LGKAYRLIQAELTLEEVIRIKADPNMRLTTSPFGVTPAQYEKAPPIYPGRAVSWKGAVGIDDTYRKALAYGKGSADALISGLKKAIKISKAYAGVMGTVLYEGKLYPAKCIAQKRWREEHSNI